MVQILIHNATHTPRGYGKVSYIDSETLWGEWGRFSSRSDIWFESREGQMAWDLGWD